MDRDPAKALALLEGAVDKYVKQQARSTIARNVEHDEARVGYARVAGPDSCEFCQMQSSRGFAFSSSSAAHADDGFHAHCSCGLAVAFKDRKGRIRAEGIDGEIPDDWDPAELYEQYAESGKTFAHSRARENAARRAVRNGGSGGGGNNRNILFTGGDGDEKRRAIEAYKNQERETAKRINETWRFFKQDESEANYRATMGAYIESFSSRGQIDAEFRAKPQAKELIAAERMSRNGHEIVFLSESGGGKHADALIDGIASDFKRIESDKRGKIYQRIKDASEKADAVVVDLSLGTIEIEDAAIKAEEAIQNNVIGRGSVTILNWDGSEIVI